MLVVADTSPLNYLVLIQHERLLPTLYTQVLVPPAVLRELADPETPEAVRTWIANPPAWLERRAPQLPPQRDQHLLAIARTDRFHWKRTSGYDAQAHAENAFSRYKRTFGSRLRAKRDTAQKRETQLACRLLNRMRELGRPSSSRVS